jgi:hypothetical protein
VLPANEKDVSKISTKLITLQAYVDGVSVCIDGGRILLANGQE